MEVRSGYLSPLLQNLSKPLPLHPMCLNGITARRIPNRSLKNQLNAPESVIIGNYESNEKIGCSKTVFKRVSSGFMSYKTFLCVSTVIPNKSFRIDGYREYLLHGMIRGSSVCRCGLYLLALNPEGDLAAIITMQVRELLDEITRGVLPRNYEVDSRGGTPRSRISIPAHHVNKSDDASFWKINKNKGNLAGGIRARNGY